MRKKLLGTIAALAAGAGGALAQSPTRPTAPVAIGTVGGFDDGGVMQANSQHPAVPPPMMGMGEGGPPMGGVDPMMGAGGPVYPPPGIMGQGGYEEPAQASLLSTLYVDGQYLLGFPKSQPTGFPLLTSGAATAGEQGRIGASTTTILAGAPGTLNLGTAHGFRISGGVWRPQDHRLGVEAGGFYFAPVSNTAFLRSSDQGIPLISRPFISTASGAQGILLVSSPNAINGEALSRATTTFWGAEGSAIVNVYRACPDNCRTWTLNLLVGYRYAELDESLTVSTRSTLLPGITLPFANITVGAPTSIEVRDLFHIVNKFNGGQVGLQSHFRSGRWYVGATGKVAFGSSSSSVTVDGTSYALDPTTQGAANPANRINSQAIGGLFANASNIGRYKADQFAILTDVNGSVGYNFTSWLTGTVGYNFMHLSAVSRPGSLFNGRVDPSLVPTSGTYGTGANGSPAFSIKPDDFWVHGVNFGFLIRY